MGSSIGEAGEQPGGVEGWIKRGLGGQRNIDWSIRGLGRSIGEVRILL